MWWTGWIALLLLVGCGSSPSSAVDDDELVGRPADTDAAPADDPEPVRRGALWYRIEPDDRDITIRLRLLSPPDETTFFLPGPWAERDDFDEQIRLDGARGPADDTPLPTTVDRSDGRIDVATDDVDWVELVYHVDTDALAGEDDEFAPRADNDAFFAYAPTILILPSAHIAERLRDIPVEVHVPPDWTVSATWPRQRNVADQQRRIAGFVADDLRTLRDAYVGAGRHWRQLEARAAGRPMRLTLTGDFAFDDRTLLEATTELVDEYLRQFGTYDQISAIIHPLDDDSLRGAGRHGGFVLEVPADATVDASLLVLMAHEAFHMWNGHQLVPAPDIEDQTQWFKEGVTHYIGLKTLAGLDLIEPATVRDELARATHYYVHNPLRSGGHIRTIDRIRYPYDRGLLIGLALDAALLDSTDGAVGIEDWIQLLLSPTWADEANRYDPSLLRDSFGQLADGKALRRYRRLVDRQEPIDVHRLFDELGLHFLEAAPDEDARLLPIDDQHRPFERLFAPPDPTTTDDDD